MHMQNECCHMEYENNAIIRFRIVHLNFGASRKDSQRYLAHAPYPTNPKK